MRPESVPAGPGQALPSTFQNSTIFTRRRPSTGPGTARRRAADRDRPREERARTCVSHFETILKLRENLLEARILPGHPCAAASGPAAGLASAAPPGRALPCALRVAFGLLRRVPRAPGARRWRRSLRRPARPRPPPPRQQLPRCRCTRGRAPPRRRRRWRASRGLLARVHAEQPRRHRRRRRGGGGGAGGDGDGGGSGGGGGDGPQCAALPTQLLVAHRALGKQLRRRRRRHRAAGTARSSVAVAEVLAVGADLGGAPRAAAVDALVERVHVGARVVREAIVRKREDAGRPPPWRAADRHARPLGAGALRLVRSVGTP